MSVKLKLSLLHSLKVKNISEPSWVMCCCWTCEYIFATLFSWILTSSRRFALCNHKLSLRAAASNVTSPTSESCAHVAAHVGGHMRTWNIIRLPLLRRLRRQKGARSTRYSPVERNEKQNEIKAMKLILSRRRARANVPRDEKLLHTFQ